MEVDNPCFLILSELMIVNLDIGLTRRLTTIIRFTLMTKKCELTGVLPLKGHNVSHANNKTKRRFLPNLKKVNFKSDILKKNVRLSVSNAALRTVDFKGGLDKFLEKAKIRNLSKKAQKIKISILSRK